MSEKLLNFIPTDPWFVPQSAAQLNAKVFLERHYADNQIEFIITDSPEFVDQGANFDSVSCNLCGTQLEIEDWQNAMDAAFQNGFNDLHFMTPCCQTLSSLNDLEYKMPAGFARHIIRISSPSGELADDEVLQLENIVGTNLRIVWARY